MTKQTYMFQGKRFVFTGSFFSDIPIYAHKRERILLENGNKIFQHYELTDRAPAQG